jgi:hypothetical protein
MRNMSQTSSSEEDTAPSTGSATELEVTSAETSAGSDSEEDLRFVQHTDPIGEWLRREAVHHQEIKRAGAAIAAEDWVAALALFHSAAVLLGDPRATHPEHGDHRDALSSVNNAIGDIHLKLAQQSAQDAPPDEPYDTTDWVEAQRHLSLAVATATGEDGVESFPNHPAAAKRRALAQQEHVANRVLHFGPSEARGGGGGGGGAPPPPP